MKIKSDENICGLTVKDILINKLGLSRSQITALKKNPCGIQINGMHVTVRAVLKEKDILTLSLEDEISDINADIEPVAAGIDIIYEDNDIVAVNKPAGMPTHPSHNHHSDTLANALSYYFQQKNTPFVFRSVNRLDRETSGIVLIAKNRHSAYRLSQSMQKGCFVKTYYAVVEGELTHDGEIETYIRRRADSIIFRCACQEGSSSEYAYTRYEIVSVCGGYTCVRAFPKTGRTHQLRVSFAHIGHPIVSDGLYGTADKNFARLMLHAGRLSFPHPESEEMINVEAPLPDEFGIYVKNGGEKIEIQKIYKKIF